MKCVTAYVLRHLSPLDIHPIQAVRLMLLEKYFQLGEKWCKPGAQLQFLLFLLSFSVACSSFKLAPFCTLAPFCKLAQCLVHDNSVIPSSAICRLRRVLGLFQAFSVPSHPTNTSRVGSRRHQDVVPFAYSPRVDPRARMTWHIPTRTPPTVFATKRMTKTAPTMCAPKRSIDVKSLDILNRRL
jgi:hypothetical protein